jgi:putative FmdB family regulatory protein
MPLYEYKCHSCGKKFEVIQKFSDEPLTTHEDCGGDVEKLVSAPAFHFKGTGWYVTDYAKGNSGAPKSDGGKADEAAKSGDSKSGDSKSSDSKSGDSKSSEGKHDSGKSDSGSKSTESKSSESKPAESKPAATTTTESK